MGKLFRKRTVLDKYELSNSTLYRKIAAGEFPPPIRIGPNCVRWDEDQLEAWKASRPSGVDSPRGRGLRGLRVVPPAAA